MGGVPGACDEPDGMGGSGTSIALVMRYKCYLGCAHVPIVLPFARAPTLAVGDWGFFAVFVLETLGEAFGLASSLYTGHV